MISTPDSHRPGTPVQAAGSNGRTWRSGLTVTLPWWLVLLATLFATVVIFPLGPVLAVWLVQRKHTRPLGWVVSVLSTVLFVYWFTRSSVTQLGLMSR